MVLFPSCLLPCQTSIHGCYWVPRTQKLTLSVQLTLFHQCSCFSMSPPGQVSLIDLACVFVHDNARDCLVCRSLTLLYTAILGSRGQMQQERKGRQAEWSRSAQSEKQACKEGGGMWWCSELWVLLISGHAAAIRGNWRSMPVLCS